MSYSLAGSAQDAPIFVIMVVLCHTHPVQGTTAGGPKPLLVWMVGRGSPAVGALLADRADRVRVVHRGERAVEAA